MLLPIGTDENLLTEQEFQFLEIEFAIWGQNVFIFQLEKASAKVKSYNYHPVTGKWK